MRRLFPQYIYDGADSPFQWLPNEVVVHVFGFLDVVALARAASTCSLWRCLAADQKLWRGLCRSQFPLARSLHSPTDLTRATDHRAVYRGLFLGEIAFPVQVMNPRRSVETAHGHAPFHRRSRTHCARGRT